MGSSMHSRECGKATAVACPPSRRTSSLKLKTWFQALEFAASCAAVAKYIVAAAEGAGDENRLRCSTAALSKNSSCCNSEASGYYVSAWAS